MCPLTMFVSPLFAGIPADLTVTSSVGAPTFPFVTASDNDPAFTDEVASTEQRVDHSCSEPEAGQFLYKLLRSWSATDPSGNTSPVESQTVTVVDDERPSILNTPSNTAAPCDQVPPQAVLTATDNDQVCFDPNSVQAMQTRLDGRCPYNYTLTRTWAVADAAGNTHDTSQTVQVRRSRAYRRVQGAGPGVCGLTQVLACTCWKLGRLHFVACNCAHPFVPPCFFSLRFGVKSLSLLFALLF